MSVLFCSVLFLIYPLPSSPTYSPFLSFFSISFPSPFLHFLKLFVFYNHSFSFNFIVIFIFSLLYCRDPFTIKITGGPDGDVAGNLIRYIYPFIPCIAPIHHSSLPLILSFSYSSPPTCSYLP